MSAVSVQVMMLMRYSLDSGSDALIDYLFQDCQLLNWLLDAPHTVTPHASPFDSKAATRKPLRAGYLGHMTIIANQYVSRKSCPPPPPPPKHPLPSLASGYRPHDHHR